MAYIVFLTGSLRQNGVTLDLDQVVRQAEFFGLGFGERILCLRRSRQNVG